jgi:hypothetical protein
MKMKILAFSVMMLAGRLAWAQDYPRFELSAGYSYGSVDTQGYSTQRDAQGWSGSLTANVKKWVGMETEVSGRYNALRFDFQGSSLTYNSAYYTFLAGPRLAHRRGKATPFVHALFGVDRAPAYDNTVYDPATLVATTPYVTGFATAAGGGLDYALSRRLSFRSQGDYFFTRHATTLAPTPNNFRVMAALVFTFGGTDSLVSQRHNQPAVLAEKPAAPVPTLIEPSQLNSAPAEENSYMAAENIRVENNAVEQVMPPSSAPALPASAGLMPPANPELNANVRAPEKKITVAVVPQPSPVRSASAASVFAKNSNTVLISSGSNPVQAATEQEESLGEISRKYREKKRRESQAENSTQPGL